MEQRVANSLVLQLARDLEELLGHSPAWTADDDLVVIRRILRKMTVGISKGMKKCNMETLPHSKVLAAWLPYGGKVPFINDKTAPLDLETFRKAMEKVIEFASTPEVRGESGDGNASANPPNASRPSQTSEKETVKSSEGAQDASNRKQDKAKRKASELVEEGAGAEKGGKKTRNARTHRRIRRLRLGESGEVSKDWGGGFNEEGGSDLGGTTNKLNTSTMKATPPGDEKLGTATAEVNNGADGKDVGHSGGGADSDEYVASDEDDSEPPAQGGSKSRKRKNAPEEDGPGLYNPRCGRCIQLNIVECRY
ncbi:hypothetical protein NMY22_g15021 [Coprinellus aureogranulatus]|nr:hypothetical protein NMY22_g15021 [Coprinellus aureogranulatus]